MHLRAAVLCALGETDSRRPAETRPDMQLLAETLEAACPPRPPTMCSLTFFTPERELRAPSSLYCHHHLPWAVGCVSACGEQGMGGPQVGRFYNPQGNGLSLGLWSFT